jgi:hypothetical protein
MMRPDADLMRPVADLMRPVAPQVNGQRSVPTCPKWCTVDHAVQAGEDREYHSGDTRELRLPDGRVALDVTLIHEPGQALPRLAVATDALTGYLDEVALVDDDQAAQLESTLMALTQYVQRVRRYLRGATQPPVKRGNPGRRVRAAWRETRLFLAERDGWRCFYCRTKFDQLKGVTIDHYVPASMWACNLPANLVLSCRPCNLAKGDRLTWSMAAVLLAWQRDQVGVPDRHTVTVTAGTVGREATQGAGNGAPGDVQAPPARSLPASLAG